MNQSEGARAATTAADPFATGRADAILREESEVSWRSRLGGASGGLAAGLALILTALFVITWNEIRAVGHARSLMEGAAGIRSVPADLINPAQEGRRVHVVGALTPQSTLDDDEMQITVRALRLVRQVRIYQWREETRSETRRNASGLEEMVTTRTYSRVWSDHRIDSSRFRQADGHHNPEMRYRAREFLPSAITLGAFRLGEGMMRALPADEVYLVPPETIERLRQRHGAGVHLQDGRIYLGADPASPRVGDMVVSYRIARPQVASLVAMQIGDALGGRGEDPLAMVAWGELSASAMVAQGRHYDPWLSWAIRLMGSGFLFLGFAMMVRPLTPLADVVPMLGDLIAAGLGLTAFVLTVLVAPAIIGLVWVWQRPFLAIGLMLVGFVLAILLAGITQRPDYPFRSPRGSA